MPATARLRPIAGVRAGCFKAPEYAILGADNHFVRARSCLLPLPLLLAGVGCGLGSATAPDLLEPTKTGDAFEGVQCSAVRPPTEPDLMGWDSGSRLNLKQLQENGVVGVRYKAEGCNVELEVLKGCDRCPLVLVTFTRCAAG